MKQPKGVLASVTASLVFLAFLWVLCAPLPAQQKLTAAQAKDHIGEEAVVCGVVASTRYAATSRGRPTFLNLDRPYPNQVFTVVIWGENRAKFGKPEVDYEGKRICVTGTITSYRGVPQIVVDEPEQIKIQQEKKSRQGERPVRDSIEQSPGPVLFLVLTWRLLLSP